MEVWVGGWGGGHGWWVGARRAGARASTSHYQAGPVLLCQLVGRHPATVEAKGHGVGHAQAGHRLGGHGGGIVHNQIALPRLRVGDVGQQEAVVLGDAARAPHKHRLATQACAAVQQVPSHRALAGASL